MQKFPVAVPLSEIVCGLSGALSVSDNVAVRAAAEFEHAGANVTCRVHVALGAVLAFVPMQEFALMEKSLAFAPEVAAAVTARDPVPVFVSEIVTGALVTPES